VLPDGRRLDESIGTGFALISAVPLSAEHHAQLEKRGTVIHIAGAGTELADWLRRGHSTAAIIRPDRTVMRAGTNLTELCGFVPTFTANSGSR
jgi:3-(3-hydroxy-phenyl)propionate hydroxylase